MIEGSAFSLISSFEFFQEAFILASKDSRLLWFLDVSLRFMCLCTPLLMSTVSFFKSFTQPLVPSQTFKDVGHFADLGEAGPVGPGKDHVHQVRLELAQIRLLVHFQLGVCRHFGDALRTLLDARATAGVSKFKV